MSSYIVCGKGLDQTIGRRAHNAHLRRKHAALHVLVGRHVLHVHGRVVGDLIDAIETRDVADDGAGWDVHD